MSAKHTPRLCGMNPSNLDEETRLEVEFLKQRARQFGDALLYAADEIVKLRRAVNEYDRDKREIENLKAQITEMQIQHSKGFYTPLHEADRKHLLAENKQLRESQAALLEAAKIGLKNVKEALELSGACDHSINICSCELIKDIETITKAIAQAQVRP